MTESTPALREETSAKGSGSGRKTTLSARGIASRCQYRGVAAQRGAVWTPRQVLPWPTGEWDRGLEVARDVVTAGDSVVFDDAREEHLVRRVRRFEVYDRDAWVAGVDRRDLIVASRQHRAWGIQLSAPRCTEILRK